MSGRIQGGWPRKRGGNPCPWPDCDYVAEGTNASRRYGKLYKHRQRKHGGKLRP